MTARRNKITLKTKMNLTGEDGIFFCTILELVPRDENKDKVKGWDGHWSE